MSFPVTFSTMGRGREGGGLYCSFQQHSQCHVPAPQLARPNILMFGDRLWDESRTGAQEDRFQEYLTGESVQEIVVDICVVVVRKVPFCSFLERYVRGVPHRRVGGKLNADIRVCLL